MTFEKLKEILDTLTLDQQKQKVSAFFSHDCFEDLMLVSTPEGALIFIPELELTKGGEDAVESS